MKSDIWIEMVIAGALWLACTIIILIINACALTGEREEMARRGLYALWGFFTFGVIVFEILWGTGGYA